MTQAFKVVPLLLERPGWRVKSGWLPGRACLGNQRDQDPTSPLHVSREIGPAPQCASALWCSREVQIRYQGQASGMDRAFDHLHAGSVRQIAWRRPCKGRLAAPLPYFSVDPAIHPICAARDIAANAFDGGAARECCQQCPYQKFLHADFRAYS